MNFNDTTNPKSKIRNPKLKRGPVLAIDGPAGSGKSAISKLLAKELGFTYVDTGAMYRAVALRAYELGIDIENETVLRDFCSKINLYFAPPPNSAAQREREKEKGEPCGATRIFIDDKDYSEKIRTPFVGQLASRVSSKKVVRDALVNLQRVLASKGFVVMEGRDIGTVVFPDADIKFYLDASPEVRGKRRYNELKETGDNVSLDKIIAEVRARDQRDSTREHAPLKRADDAVCIDTSAMVVEEVLKVMIEVIEKKGFKKSGVSSLW